MQYKSCGNIKQPLNLADSVCQILPMGILQMVSAEFPMVLIRQTLSGEFQHVEKEVKSLIWRKFFAENPRLYLRLKSFDSRLISCAPYAALASPPCSNSTIRRPISQYVAVISALTLRTVSVRALSTR